MKLLLKYVSLFLLICTSIFIVESQAATVVYTDRSIWESNITGQVITEDFESALAITVPHFEADINLIPIGTHELGAVTLQNNGGASTQIVENGLINGSLEYLSAAIKESLIENSVFIFPEPITAFGANFGGATHNTDIGAGLIVTYGSTSILFEDYFSGFGNGFLGVIDTEPFTTITFSISEKADVSSSNFSMDDLSFSAVPIPATVWLFASGLGALGVMARRCRKVPNK